MPRAIVSYGENLGRRHLADENKLRTSVPPVNGFRVLALRRRLWDLRPVLAFGREPSPCEWRASDTKARTAKGQKTRNYNG